MPKIGKIFSGSGSSSGSGKSSSDGNRIYVGDRVRMKNRKEGTVTCMGPKTGRDGVWLRLAFEEAASSGASSPSSPDSRGDLVKWVPMIRVESLLESAGKMKITVGDSIKHKKRKLGGVVRYVGQLHFEKGIWYGVELDQGKGKHNGTIKGKFYFKCARDKGMVFSGKEISLVSRGPIIVEIPHASPTDSSSRKASADTADASTGDAGDEDEDSEEEGKMDDGDDESLATEMADVSSSKKKKGKWGSFTKRLSGSRKFKKASDADDSLVSSSDLVIESPRPKAMREKSPMALFLPLCDDPTNRADRMKQEIIDSKPKKRKITLKGHHKDLYEDKLGPIMEAAVEVRQSMFRQKLHLCQAICQFTELTKVKLHMIEKKERILGELSEYIARGDWFDEESFIACLNTISRNLFRPLPYHLRPPQLFFLNDEVFDKDTAFEDPSWRHLKLVYDLVWRVINTQKVTPELMQRHMEAEILPRLVDLLASDDHRERAYLMMILHKVYGRCLRLRPHLIDLMCRYLYRMIYTTEFDHYNGVVEILQIVCAIIPGLATPVKSTWKAFLQNILVPLHKCRGLKKFWEPLTQCCVNYVAKDASGAAVMIGGLLRYWPKQSPQKEEIFIMETVNIINVLLKHQDGFEYSEFSALLIAASHQLTACMLSTRQPVAERAIAAWKETSMQDLVDLDRKNILPKLAEAFHKNRNHTNQQLRRSSTTVEQIYKNRDMVYWKDMEVYLSKKAKKEKDAQAAAEKSYVTGIAPTFPFSSKSRSKTMGETVSRDRSRAPLMADDERLRVDSFRMFALSTSDGIDYSAVMTQIKQYDAEVAAKKKKRKHLTEADKSTRRRASWAGVRIQASKREDGPKRRRSIH